MHLSIYGNIIIKRVVALKKQYEKIKEIFKKNGWYARTKDIIEAGIHTSYLYQMEEKGLIKKIKRGLYRWSNELDFGSELLEVSKIVPNGVLCLVSALDYYEITTYSSWEYYIAIHRSSRKPVTPDYPPIRFFYFSQKQFETGIEEIEIEGEKIKIYDLEKTLCDVVRLRNKVGMDVVKDSLQEYVKRKDRNINKLLHYAEITGVPNLMENYLEVLV